MVFLSGCSAIFSDQKVEENCFPEFTVKAGEFFEVLQNNRAYIWPIGGEGDDSAGTPFLVKNGINGFLLPDETMSSSSISSSEKLRFTGRVFKKWPNWGEYYIGSGRKNIKLEVVAKGKKYLVFNMYIPNSLKSKLQQRCTFK